MKRLNLVAIALTIMSCNVLAGDQGHFQVAGGAGTGGANFSIGGGTNVDELEISSIDLGTVDGTDSARFVGISLVQNAEPVNNLGLLFRLGFGKATTTFTDGSTASRLGLGDGVFFGIGAKYQLNNHLAFRAEVNRITYATSADGLSFGISYPVTIGALYRF